MGRIVEQKKKSNKQWRREIIADVNRREAEKKKEKWRVRKCWAVIYGIGFLCPMIILLIVLLNIHNDKVTFTNIMLGLITINGGFFLCVYIGLKAVWNMYPKIPLKNDGKLKLIALPDHWKSSTGEKYEFNRIDDKQIVIDNDYVLARIFLFLLLFIIFLALVYFADATPSKLTTEDYGSTLLLLELYLLILTPGISAILQPWRRIVFDRVSRTVTIPGRLLLHKKETIPYSQAELTIRYYMGLGSLVCVSSIIISNSNSPSLLSGVSLMDGDMDKARRFARFIQLYMEEEELPDMPEFEKYRNKKEQEHTEIEKEIPIWKR